MAGRPSSPTSVAQYLYGDGTRVALQTMSGGAQTVTAYVGNVEEVATTTGGMTPGTQTTTYYYAGPIRVATAVNGTLSYLADDVLGTDTVAFDASGTPIASRLYDPYGHVRYSLGAMPGTYGFTGQREDAATGLDYFVYRYYDPTAGQFISPDSVLPANGADLRGLSRYAYAEGNPSTKTDPSGHCPFCVTALIGAVVGAAVGAATTIATQSASGSCCDWGQVAGEAAIGAVSGAITGLLGPAGGAVATTLVHAAVGAAVGAGSQAASNLVEGKPLGDGVLMSATIGGIAGALGSPAVSKFIGNVVGRAGSAVGKLAGRAGEGISDLASKAGALFARGGCSFSADTPVATPDGSQNIGTLQVGDQVDAYDPTTGQVSTQTVEHVWINHDDDLIDLLLQTDGNSAAQASQTDDDTQHQAELLAHGTRAPPPQTIARNHITPTDQQTYAVQRQPEAVHTTANHPWLTVERGWVSAGDIHVGEHIRRLDGTTTAVVSVRSVAGAATMYDLTISQVHTFAVGDGHYVVHNTGSGFCKLGAEAAEEAAGGFGKAAKKITYVIGENMKDRVIPYAKANGYKYFKPRSPVASRWLPNNKNWIQWVMRKGYDIVDIGPDGPVATSEYYIAETSAILRRNYLHYRQDFQP